MRRNIVIAAVIALALLVMGGVGYWLGSRERTAPPAPNPSTPTAAAPLLPADLRFIDDFAVLNRERYYIAERAHGGDHIENDWKESHVSITDEGLEIVMSANEPGTFPPLTSGEIGTGERYLYGYFEARMRVPRGAGVIAGFFTYAGPWQGVEPPQELDVELLGQNTRLLYTASHVARSSDGRSLRMPFDAADAFHTYGIEWTRDAFRWYVDGRLMHEVRGERVTRMNAPQPLWVNLWATRQLSGWAGSVDYDQGPWRLTVSCLASSETYPGRPICPQEP